MSEEKELSFEEAMEKLENIVELLEDGEAPLEKAIAIYKEGMDLSRVCHKKLKSVEEQLTQILREDGKLNDFTAEEE
ncbi:exodeoxyribonuclease VII small subunit [Peribacillus deserti]|uniref:Exodeoxyribonuclease 7 small subunit n=1 Tax=Peribacillus deserti TaxID=673318 RepID=A0ABS2QJX4_9BACI|nr:exodeoxyribonuclease VII small subunit [Peribacillus deserti]MBM7693250.1 exodeoxyribonuclease VII small subunit [Peribacillus deserti]